MHLKKFVTNLKFESIIFKQSNTNNSILRSCSPSKLRFISVDGLTETTFPGQVQNFRAFYLYLDGQSVVYKLCLDAQTGHLFLMSPNGRGAPSIFGT